MRSVLAKGKKFIMNPDVRLGYLTKLGCFRFMPDDKYLKMAFKIRMGYDLDLDNPVTFNEKLQWLKLYDRKAEYVKMVDKYEVKKYVADIIGEKYIIPTLGIWNRFDEIDFDKLPDRFVLKCTHDCGSVVIITEKRGVDWRAVRTKLEKSLKHNYYYKHREWPYKNVQPRIIAEEYMEDSSDSELRDYKFYCFNGYAEAVLVATNRQRELCFDYFDSGFNHLNMISKGHPNAKKIPHKPKNYTEMKSLAEKLSKGFPHIRVDFYEADDRIYFGELTFFPMGGYLISYPDDWETRWGGLIDLSLVKKE